MFSLTKKKKTTEFINEKRGGGMSNYRCEEHDVTFKIQRWVGVTDDGKEDVSDFSLVVYIDGQEYKEIASDILEELSHYCPDEK